MGGEWRAHFPALHRGERRVWEVVYHAAEPPATQAAVNAYGVET